MGKVDSVLALVLSFYRLRVSLEEPIEGQDLFLVKARYKDLFHHKTTITTIVSLPGGVMMVVSVHRDPFPLQGVLYLVSSRVPVLFLSLFLFSIQKLDGDFKIIHIDLVDGSHNTGSHCRFVFDGHRPCSQTNNPVR